MTEVRQEETKQMWKERQKERRQGQNESREERGKVWRQETKREEKT